MSYVKIELRGGEGVEVVPDTAYSIILKIDTDELQNGIGQLVADERYAIVAGLVDESLARAEQVALRDHLNETLD